MIRRYENKDLEQSAQVLMDTLCEEPWNETWSKELAETRIAELLSGPQAVGYVYVYENEIVAVMCGRKTTYIHGKEYFIDEFCILPKMQRRGIGSAMIDYAKTDLKKEGFVNIVLNTEKGFPSEHFYLKNGFQTKESLIFMYLDF